MNAVSAILRMQPDSLGWSDIRDVLDRCIEGAAFVYDFRAQRTNVDMSVALRAEKVTVLRHAPSTGIEFLGPLDRASPKLGA